MANCPNCGSDHIQPVTQTHVNWGETVGLSALANYLDIDAVIVSTGERQANCCMNCGNTWLASSLYYSTKMIEELGGMKLDLSQEPSRKILNEALPIFHEYSQRINLRENQTKQNVQDTNSIYFIWGGGIFLAICLLLFSLPPFWSVVSLVCTYFFGKWYKKNTPTVEDIKKKGQDDVFALEEDLKKELMKIRVKYSV